MYLTKAQMRALWFIIIVFGISVFYQYAKIWFFPEAAYDFSSFEQAFIRRRDSLLTQEKLDSLREISEQQQKPASYQSEKIKGLPVNINTASKETLMSIKGVGEQRAEAIIQYRKKNGPFTNIDQLADIRGIGQSLIDANRDTLVVKDNK